MLVQFQIPQELFYGGGSPVYDELDMLTIATLEMRLNFGKFTVNGTANQDGSMFLQSHGGLWINIDRGIRSMSNVRNPKRCNKI